jgi:hypothetical protein
MSRPFDIRNVQVASGCALRLGLRGRARKLLLAGCGLGVMILSPAVPATIRQKPPSARPGTHKVARALLVAAKAPTPAQQEQMPQQAPPPTTQLKVTYEAGELTIIAENSKLSDILSSLRACMGADIDLPASASGERIWARLGPGPARKVLATLLSGTKLDYIIQASDVDPDGIRSVWLTVRTEGPAVTTARANSPAVRPLPPRGSDADRRVVPNRTATEPRGQDDTPPQEPAASADIAPAASQPKPTAADATPGTPQPPAADAATASAAQASEADKSTPSTPPANPTDQMIQTLQNMYEQRKQMQLARTPQAPN